MNSVTFKARLWRFSFCTFVPGGSTVKLLFTWRHVRDSCTQSTEDAVIQCMMSGSTARRVSAYQTMDSWRVDVGATATSVHAAAVNAKTQSHSHTDCLVIQSQTARGDGQWKQPVSTVRCPGREKTRSLERRRAVVVVVVVVVVLVGGGRAREVVVVVEIVVVLLVNYCYHDVLLLCLLCYVDCIGN